MLIMRILEIILIVLILRAVISMLLQVVKKKHSPVKRFEEKVFDKKKMDIIDGDFKDLK
jgi:hypothetical protein